MSTQVISLFRVPHWDTPWGFVYAMVTDEAIAALQRLRNDDAAWRSLEVELVWQHRLSDDCRLKVRDRNMIFRAKGKQVRDHVRAERRAA